MKSVTDEKWNQLLNQALAGDCSARERLFVALRARLLTVVQFKLRGLDKSVHEDLVQDAMLTVAEKVESITENPQYFALTVLRNKIGDFLRRRKSSAAYVTEMDDVDYRESPDLAIAGSIESDTDIASEVEMQELISRIARAVNMLAAHCQAYFEAALAGYSVAEILHQQRQYEPNLSRSKFDSRIFRCRQKLMALMHPYPNGSILP